MGQRRTPAEIDAGVAPGATPWFCWALTLPPFGCLLLYECVGTDAMRGRPRPGSSSGPQHVNLDLGRMRRMLGVHASQGGPKTPVNVVRPWEALLQG